MHRYFNFFVRWGILGATLIFLIKTLLSHWQDVKALELQQQAWLYGGAAFAIALFAQLWLGILWCWILAAFKHPLPKRWAIITFLRHTLAKYIPGSVWHLYGQVKAAQKKGLGLELATLSVLLEPLFVIAAAIGLALWNTSYGLWLGALLGVILLILHPRVLNFLWQQVRKLKGKQVSSVKMQYYPLRVLLGAIFFMVLRGLIFILIVLAFTPINWSALSPLMSGFSMAWLLSLVIPTPAGMGVFEASAIDILHPYLSPGLLLAAVAIYRFINVGAEMMGAGCAYLLKEG
ncbi:lysylphosphatidylglycerol synthase domain-containing protein [Acaryochloris sp. CCMEE 5410]|uniref:lysylphosphatidylglycerol synthase domain-containing protein n=1 Tax=Acaryochloris sp. CCMEE 5410 TaxID=310037 RepID=UPI000248452D|nr:lysylphosphatidylglycerol synthase domain-containing protein [Acaryochloris sp. CCMEE 5410]KAI9134870.1 flippase-like domain-containing protein [Acaryochloris sp. CCMEE 5410]